VQQLDYRFQFIFNERLRPVAAEILTRENGKIPSPERDFEIIEKAFETAERLAETGIPISLHVNVYPQNLSRIQFKDFYPLSHRIVFEVLEEGIFNEEEIREAINEAKRWGFSVYLDDFGSGRANYSLLQLPFSGVKVDAVVVPETSAQYLLDRNFRVVAEKTRSLTYPAHLYQGFLLHRPEPLEELVSSYFALLPSSF